MAGRAGRVSQDAEYRVRCPSLTSRCSKWHRPPRCERARVARRHTCQLRTVSKDHAGHSILFDPVHSEGRIDFRTEVHSQEAIALQPPRRHENKDPKRRVGKTETLWHRLREKAD